MQTCQLPTSPWILRVQAITMGVFISAILLLPGISLGHEAAERYHQAQSAAKAQQWPQAEDFLKQALQHFPNYAEAHHLLGLIQFEVTHDPASAIPSLQQAITLAPHLVQAQYDLALMYLRQQKMEEAQPLLKKALGEYPTFWEAALALAQTFEQQGQIPQALEQYNSVLIQAPDQPEALYAMGYLNFKDGQWEEAHQSLTRLVKAHTQHSEGWLLLGRVEEMRNQPTQAIQAYETAVTLQPASPQAHHSLAFLYQQQGEVSKAIEHFEAVTQRKPNDFEAFMNLGVLLSTVNDTAKAKEAYLHALAINKASPELQYNLGNFFEFHEVDLDRAKQHYRRYIELGGTDLRVQRLLEQLGPDLQPEN